jgi:hypothetical protein
MDIDGGAMDFAQMPECCRNAAATIILKSSGDAPGFACLSCRSFWEKTSPIDGSLARKIDILKGKA